MTFRALTFRLLSLAALLALAPGCQPIGAADPLDSAQRTAGPPLPVISKDPNRQTPDRFLPD